MTGAPSAFQFIPNVNCKGKGMGRCNKCWSSTSVFFIVIDGAVMFKQERDIFATVKTKLGAQYCLEYHCMLEHLHLPIWKEKLTYDMSICICS